MTSVQAVRPPLVAVRDARYVYRGGVVALDGVSVDIEAGEVVGLIGQNGSGKTTFSKLLNGALRPSDGKVLIDGIDTARHPVQVFAPIVGYVFQNPNHQLFASTVAEELSFGPRNIGCTRDEVEERVADAVAFFELGDILGEHPYRLTFPVRKIVAIASVFTMRPRLLILDEPTTGQDHRTTTAIDRLIGRLAERGDTVLCVTHDMPLVASVAGRVLLMDDGRLVADGSPREVFADHPTMTQARLLPPQIARLSSRLPERAGRTPVLTVDELVREYAPVAAETTR